MTLQSEKTNRRWGLAAKIMIGAGFAAWIPNLVFQAAWPLWLATFPLGTLAFICACKVRSKAGIALSVLLFASFFILVGTVYLTEAISSFLGR